MMWWEDFEVGETVEMGRHSFSERERLLSDTARTRKS
jgi:hypothetical protein